MNIKTTLLHRKGKIKATIGGNIHRRIFRVSFYHLYITILSTSTVTGYVSSASFQCYWSLLHFSCVTLSSHPPVSWPLMTRCLFTQWNYWVAIIAMSGVRGARTDCKYFPLLILTPLERPYLHLLVPHEPMQVHSNRDKTLGFKKKSWGYIQLSPRSFWVILYTHNVEPIF